MPFKRSGAGGAGSVPAKSTSAVLVPLKRAPDSGFKFKGSVFLSYGHGDATPFARWLKGMLESRGYKVWLDEAGIAAASNWQSAIGDAIKQCDALVAIIDAKFCASKFCRQEVGMASSNGKPLVPVLLREFQYTDLPSDLEYMLTLTQCTAFVSPETDAEQFEILIGACERVIGNDQPKSGSGRTANPGPRRVSQSKVVPSESEH